MTLLSLLTGLVSIFTPIVFLMILVTIAVYNKIGASNKNRLLYILTFFIVTLCFHLIFGLSIIKANPSLADTTLLKTMGYFVICSNLLLSLLLIGVFNFLFTIQTRQKLFGLLFIILLSIVFAAESFSSTAPILGSIIISNISNKDFASIALTILGFSIGLTIPVGLLVFFSVQWTKKIERKRWWTILQLTLGIILLITTTVGIYNKYF